MHNDRDLSRLLTTYASLSTGRAKTRHQYASCDRPSKESRALYRTLRNIEAQMVSIAHAINSRSRSMSIVPITLTNALCTDDESAVTAPTTAVVVPAASPRQQSTRETNEQKVRRQRVTRLLVALEKSRRSLNPSPPHPYDAYAVLAFARSLANAVAIALADPRCKTALSPQSRGEAWSELRRLTDGIVTKAEAATVARAETMFTGTFPLLETGGINATLVSVA